MASDVRDKRREARIYRIAPSTHEVRLEDFQGRMSVELDRRTDEQAVFAVDIYSFQPQNHPENHLGWWHIPVGPGRHRLDLAWDFRTIREGSLRVVEAGETVRPSEHWVNPAYRLTPLQDCRLVFRNAGTEIVGLKRILLKVDDPGILKAYYERTFEAGGYSPDAPFLDLLHRYKLKVLAKDFDRRFRGLVLDVGCGRCLFTDMGRTWNFRIVAGDIVLNQIKARKRERPDIGWVVFDAARLPFKAGTFDGLFAGEILEHLPDPGRGVDEWNRVQKPGGILIVTTPNRKRRINRLNREAWPVSPDHLREHSFEELNGEILPGSGYRPIRRRGLYLELLARSNGWWKDDHLQRVGNIRANRRLMGLLFRVGRLFRRRALELITVARKKY